MGDVNKRIGEWNRVRIFVGILLVVALGGCLGGESPSDARTDDVRFYRVAYEGSDKYHTRGGHSGFLATAHNDGDGPVIVAFGEVTIVTPDGHVLFAGFPDRYESRPDGAQVTRPSLLESEEYGLSFLLEPGQGALIGKQAGYFFDYGLGAYDANWTMRVHDAASQEEIRSETMSWTYEIMPFSFDMDVSPGDHVRTVTVGFWLNGTSFYTNAADLLVDPDFPGAPGWVSADDGSDPLPVYVYEQGREEQPYGSQDNCYFTTITGYNDLVDVQTLGSTGIRLLQPEEAYTLPGYEDHDLYGDPIVFMNTVIAHDGATNTQDELPDPDGTCYERERPCGDATDDVPDGVPDEVKAPLVKQCEDALQEG